MLAMSLGIKYLYLVICDYYPPTYRKAYTLSARMHECAYLPVNASGAQKEQDRVRLRIPP